MKPTLSSIKRIYNYLSIYLLTRSATHSPCWSRSLRRYFLSLNFTGNALHLIETLIRHIFKWERQRNRILIVYLCCSSHSTCEDISDTIRECVCACVDFLCVLLFCSVDVTSSLFPCHFPFWCVNQFFSSNYLHWIFLFPSLIILISLQISTLCMCLQDTHTHTLSPFVCTYFRNHSSVNVFYLWKSSMCNRLCCNQIYSIIWRKKNLPVEKGIN